MFDQLAYLDTTTQIYVYALLFGGVISIAAAFLPHAFKVAGRIGMGLLGLGMIGYAVYILQPSTTEYRLFYYAFIIPIYAVIAAFVNIRKHTAESRQAAMAPGGATGPYPPEGDPAAWQASGTNLPPAPGAPQAPWQDGTWQAPAGQANAPAAGWPAPADQAPAGGFQAAAPAPAATQAPVGQAACKKCGGPLPYVGAACANH